jgi:hypothetical protein
MLSTPVNIDQVPCDQEQTQSRGADSETSSTHMRMSLRAMSSLCKNWCNCSCHLRRSVQTPSIVRGVLGKLFFDYTGVPILSSKCDQRACLQQPKRSARVTFYFPSWFLARVFVASLMYTGQRGPELLLRLPRVLPPRSEIFHFAETGNVGGIHQLFRTGKASVYDVDSSGSTILHVSRAVPFYQTVLFPLRKKTDAGSLP